MYNFTSALRQTLCSICLFLISGAVADTYWVNKSGNDNNSCTNGTFDACFTIARGISQLSSPGDVLNIGAGTYREGSGCFWFSKEASICVPMSGTIIDPVVIQAAPGDEGEVVIDSEMARVGVHIRNHDYVHIRDLRLINNDTVGIVNIGTDKTYRSEVSLISIGVQIEGNYIYNTDSDLAGSNVAGVRMDDTEDWVIRNNRIEKVWQLGAPSTHHTSGIQAYRTANALIEHNHISDADSGVLWKDHWLTDANTPMFQSEIRYNLIDVRSNGINLIPQGVGSEPPGTSNIHHNIFSGYKTGLLSNSAHAGWDGGDLTVRHNIFDSGASASGINVDSGDGLIIEGNIFSGHVKGAIVTRHEKDTNFVELISSDHNVFADSSLKITIDQGGAGVRDYGTLTSWNAVNMSSHTTLSTSNSDTNSVAGARSSLYTDIAAGDYTYAAGSPAIGLMEDDSNAGPYQIGGEIIGPGNYAPFVGISPPSAPRGFSVSVN